MDNVFSLRKDKIKVDKRRPLRSALLRNARHISNIEDFDGFAIIGWDKEGNALTAWRCGNEHLVPPALLPEFVKTSLIIGMSEANILSDDDEEE